MLKFSSIVLLLACLTLVVVARPSRDACNDWNLQANLYCNDSYVEYIENVTTQACIDSDGDVGTYGSELATDFLPDGRSILNLPIDREIYFDIIFKPERCLVAYSISKWVFNVVWPGSDVSVEPKDLRPVHSPHLSFFNLGYLYCLHGNLKTSNNVCRWRSHPL